MLRIQSVHSWHCLQVAYRRFCAYRSWVLMTRSAHCSCVLSNSYPVFPSVQRLLCTACHLLYYVSGSADDTLNGTWAAGALSSRGCSEAIAGLWSREERHPGYPAVHGGRARAPCQPCSGCRWASAASSAVGALSTRAQRCEALHQV